MSRPRRIQIVRGMKDILPEEQKYWRYFENKAIEICQNRGFQRIDFPIVENAELFLRGTGEITDIVQKEMYRVSTNVKYKEEKSTEKLVLRPEGTPSIARAYIEHGMHTWVQPVMLYYYGPMFRHDKPQAGRLRQFHQLGIEILGSAEPVIDASLIETSWAIFNALGIKELSLQINSIGCKQCRPAMRKVLVNYYKPLQSKLCPDCRQRFNKNPFRLLDCKNENCEKFIEEAPVLIDYLCDECKTHFKNVLEILDDINVLYDLNPKLVRGLDYYTRTTFEFIKIGDKKRQNSLAGGGRYDDLIGLLGGPKTPAIGIAFGVERIIDEIKKQEIPIPASFGYEVMLACLGDLARKKCLNLINELQKNDIKTVSALAKGSIKAQLRLANKLGANIVLIMGQKEVFDETIIMKDMVTRAQETIELKNLIPVLKKKLGKK